jgi:hypothetical protein
MFCPNCGTQLPDEAAFCGNCGTRINNQPAPQPYQAQPAPMNPDQMYPPYGEQVQPAPKKNRLPLLLGLIGGIVVVALLLVFLLGGSGGGSPEAVAEKFFTAVLECDADSAEECIHPAMWSDIGGDFSDLESMMSMFTDSITIDVKGSECVTDYGKEDVQELLDEYGIDEDLGEIYEVEVDMTISFMGMEQTETNDVVVAEIGGTYYLIDAG